MSFSHSFSYTYSAAKRILTLEKRKNAKKEKKKEPSSFHTVSPIRAKLVYVSLYFSCLFDIYVLNLALTFFSLVIATNNSSFCLKLTNIFALWKNFKASNKNAQPKETEI
jgi:hypothetical protein